MKRLFTAWALSWLGAAALVFGAEAPDVKIKQLQARKAELSSKYQRAQELAEALKELNKIEAEYREIFAQEQKLLAEKAAKEEKKSGE